jgi:hypothetical protein
MINPATGELVTQFGPLASAEVICSTRSTGSAEIAGAFLESLGPDDHHRQDHLRAAGVQLRDRDDEPRGARPGHVSAV